MVVQLDGDREFDDRQCARRQFRQVGANTKALLNEPARTGRTPSRACSASNIPETPRAATTLGRRRLSSLTRCGDSAVQIVQSSDR